MGACPRPFRQSHPDTSPNYSTWAQAGCAQGCLYACDEQKYGPLKDTNVLRIRYGSPPVHTNVSNLCITRTGISLLIRIVWYRGKAMLSRLLSYTPPGTPPTGKPPFPLPHEIVAMIIADLTHDRRALKACSSTCYSWYIAAVPHLHHTITFGEYKSATSHTKLGALSKLYELGILPLVAEVQVVQSTGSATWFASRAFNRRNLRYFSAFANVQKLKLERADISSFMPEIERYFGQFSETLRSIALFAPRCTPRQLSRFLSLFSNLDNVEIRGFLLPRRPIPDPEFVPISVPRLRGRLVLASFPDAQTWGDLNTSCSGLRFHAMDLRNVGNCAPVLLEACSETLETLRFFPVDAIGKYLSADPSAQSS